MFQRSWVQIPALYTGWAFFTFVCCKNCNLCLKKMKINEKEVGVGQFKKCTLFIAASSWLGRSVQLTAWPIISLKAKQMLTGEREKEMSGAGTRCQQMVLMISATRGLPETKKSLYLFLPLKIQLLRIKISFSVLIFSSSGIMTANDAHTWFGLPGLERIP